MSNKEELHATITARAELDRAFARLLVEDAAAVMSRNMLHIFDQQEKRTEEQSAAVRGFVKEAITEALAPVMDEFRLATEDRQELRGQVSDLVLRLDADEARLDRKRVELDELKLVQQAQQAEIGRLAAAIAARPSPEKAQATYEGVQRILRHLELDDAEQ